MMKYEFERIAGYEVSEEDYNKIIEPMYNATDLDKFDFVKVIDRKRFEAKKEKTTEQIALEKEIKEEIEKLRTDIEWYKQRLELLESFEDDFFTSEIHRINVEIRILKSRIRTLKWVLK